MPFYLSKNQRCLIRLQTHIAVKSIGSQLHVFEADIEIPTFASFKKIENEKDFSKPSSHVIFKLNESTARLCDWINSVFMTPTPVKVSFFYYLNNVIIYYYITYLILLDEFR